MIEKRNNRTNERREWKEEKKVKNDKIEWEGRRILYVACVISQFFLQPVEKPIQVELCKHLQN